MDAGKLSTQILQLPLCDKLALQFYSYTVLSLFNLHFTFLHSIALLSIYSQYILLVVNLYNDNFSGDLTLLVLCLFKCISC